MRITKLALKDWGPHANLVLEMDTPVFGLLGPNGAGKTNILSAIEFAFTGLLERKHETYVRHANGVQAANGSVQLEFRKGGLKGTIFRQVGTSPRRWLEWEGVAEAGKIKSASEIDRLMAEILDCDKRAVSLAVFLNQGHIGDFLFTKGVGREELFARMCLIDHLSAVADIAAEQIRDLSLRVTDLSSQRDEAMLGKEAALTALRNAEGELQLHPDRTLELRWLDERIAASRALQAAGESCHRQQGILRQAEERRGALPVPSLPAEYATHETYRDYLVSLAERTVAARAEAAALAREISDGTSRRQNLESRRQQRAAITTTLPEMLGLQARRSVLEAELETHTRWKTAHDVWTRLQGQLRKSEELLAALQEERAALPTIPDLNTRETAARSAQNAQAPQRLGLKLAREAEQAGGLQTGCCPLCKSTDLSGLPRGSELSRLEAELAAETTVINAELASIAGARHAGAAIEARITSGREYIADRQRELEDAVDPATLGDSASWDPAKAAEMQAVSSRLAELIPAINSLQARGEELTRLEQEVAALELPEAQEARGQALTASIARANEQLADRGSLDLYLTQRAALDQAVAQAAAQLETLAAAEVTAKVAAEHSLTARPKGLLPPPDNATVDELENGRAEVRAKQTEREQAQGAVAARLGALRGAEHRVEEIESRVAGNARIRQVIGQLEQLREAFGRTGIPRHYLSQVFDGLVEATQDNLALWEEDFQVEKDENNLFNFLFNRGNDPETLMDQSLLSGGQRTRLAISFLQASQSVVMPEVGFMVLDEPTANLDPDGVDGLGRLFETMARTADEETQVIVVSHAEALGKAMGKKVTLEKIG